MILVAELSNGDDASSYITLNGMEIVVDFANRLNLLGPEQVVNLALKMNYADHNSPWITEPLQFTEIRCDYDF